MPRGGQNAKTTDAEFVALWYEAGCSPVEVSRRLGQDVRLVYARRDSLNEKGIKLESIATGNGVATWGEKFKTAYPRERQIELLNGSIMVASDAHIWPGPRTVAMQAFINLIPVIKPKRICANGDWVDGARISRHPRIGWARTPTVKEELDAVKAYADDVTQVAIATDPECAFDYNVGNHCMRVDNYLSSRVSEMEDMPMMRLEDHLPRWTFAWSTLINPGATIPTMIKHKFANGGVHAAYNATLKSGFHTVNGHTHLLEVKPWSDYRGRRYGVQGGGLLDLHAPSVEYHENNPSPACSGFVVLTFRDGELLLPELCEVINGRAIFRSEVVA